jgi:hypothetical protein
MTVDSKYYNPNKLLSYNRILNFVIGARGIGKSFAFKEQPIKRFLKTGKQIIYLRRYKDEVKKVKKNYFNDVKSKFPDHKFEIRPDGELRIDGKTYGWMIPLSSWQSMKSNSFPDVETIIFDEFLREKDKSGYLPNEVDALLNFMDTVFRDRDDVRCVCMSNAVSIVNPYFLYFKLIPDINKRFNAYQNVVIEIPDSSDFANERRKSRFGKLIDGTDYGEMSLDNDFVNDSEVFIEPRSKESKFKFSIIYKGMKMGLWVDVDEHVMYLSQKSDPSTKMEFALSKDDLTESNLLIAGGWKTNYHLKKLVSAFMTGNLRFENQVLRNLGYEMFNKMRIT